MKDRKKDYICIGMILVLFIVIFYLAFSLMDKKKELRDTKDVVYYISDKLDIAYDMIDSLNEEQVLMQNEINEMKDVKRIVKELR